MTYKQGPLPANQEDGESEKKDSGLVSFDVLHVRLEDGSDFSALDSYLKNESVATQQKSQSLGKKLFIPVRGSGWRLLFSHATLLLTPLPHLCAVQVGDWWCGHWRDRFVLRDPYPSQPAILRAQNRA